MPLLAKDKECTGCLACYDTCKHNAIDIVLKNGFTHVRVNGDACKKCGLCSKACPIVTPLEKNKPENIKTYGGWAIDERIRIDAASGGAFTALAQSFFDLHKDEKVAVIGAKLEDNRVYHVAIEREDELPQLMNSKYIQSDTKGIYKKVAGLLNNNYWVIFSGCPCQIAGLYGYLGSKRNNGKLVTIEVVCHGIASPEAVDLHLGYYKSKKIYKFRDKHSCSQEWNYSQCTTIEQASKPVKLARKDDIFYAIYAGWLMDRTSCSNCKFATFERISDITIADFWGLNIPEFYKKGVSLVITNNIKADNLVKAAKYLYTFKASYLTAVSGNNHLFTGFKFIQYHPLVIWRSFFRKVLPDRLWFNIVTNKMPWKLFWALFKIPTIFANNIARRKHIKRLKTNALYVNLLENK